MQLGGKHRPPSESRSLRTPVLPLSKECTRKLPTDFCIDHLNKTVQTLPTDEHNFAIMVNV